MSSRRKRAPPSKVDEEKKKKLCWNMHEDRRNEVITLDDEETSEDHVPGPSTSASIIVINDDSADEDPIGKDSSGSKSVKFLTVNDEEDSYSILTPVSVQLNIIVLPYHADGSWKALLGEFALHLPSEQVLTDEFHERSFTLRGDSDDQLQVCVHKRSEEEYSNETKEYLGVYEQCILVKSTLGGEILEGLRWLQKKKIVGLYQRPGEAQALKV